MAGNMLSVFTYMMLNICFLTMSMSLTETAHFTDKGNKAQRDRLYSDSEHSCSVILCQAPVSRIFHGSHHLTVTQPNEAAPTEILHRDATGPAQSQAATKEGSQNQHTGPARLRPPDNSLFTLWAQ